MNPLRLHIFLLIIALIAYQKVVAQIHPQADSAVQLYLSGKPSHDTISKQVLVFGSKLNLADTIIRYAAGFI